MPNISTTDIAYNIISGKKRPVPFVKLWAEVAKTAKLPNDRVGQFYNDISLDGRFVSMKDNRWDLKARHTYDESHINLEDIELDNDEAEEGEVVEEEEELDSPIQIDDEY